MANMDTVLIVSPGYIDAVKSCLSRYTNFCIAGYSSVKRAIDSLYHIPGSDILGVAYLNDEILDEDVNDIRLLVNKVNILYQDIVSETKPELKRPFIFLMSSKSGGDKASADYVRSILDDVGTNNLDIGYYNYDIVTDIVIKMHMFGTILLKRRPFESFRPEIKETFNNSKCLSINLPFDEKFVDIYSPLTIIEIDEYMQKYQKEHTLLLIRSYMYNRLDTLMEEIMKNLNAMSYVDRIPYDCILRNLDLIERC